VAAWVLVLNIVALLFVVLHAVTWFAVAPDAMVLKARGRRVPRHQIIAAHYAVWSSSRCCWPGWWWRSAQTSTEPFLGCCSAPADWSPRS